MIWGDIMDASMLNGFFRTDFCIKEVVASRQNRKNKENFVFFESPRKRTALFLITDYPVKYQLISGETFVCDVGEMMLMPQGSRYAASFELPENVISHPILLSFIMMDKNGEDVWPGKDIVRLGMADGELRVLFSSAVEAYKKGKTNTVKAKIYEILGKIFPLKDEDKCAISYINRHITSTLSISELAARCDLSETAYRRQFKDLTGMSPVQYITILKIEKACELLNECDMSLNDISDFLGFNDIAYFHRVFKKITGLTPNEFREIKNIK